MGESLTTLYRTLIVHQDPTVNSIINMLIIVVTGAIAWWVFNLVLGRFNKRYSDKPFFQRNKRFFILIRKAGHYIILILVGVSLINIIHIPILEKIFYAFMILLIASFANSMSQDLLPYLEDKLTKRTSTKIDDVIFDLLKRFATVIIFTTAGILALDVIGVNIMPFIAGAGVAGIAIGFAAKDTLSNIIAGILLILDRPFEVGDRIEVWAAPANSATWGDVLDIGLRATKIQTTDNIVIIIPNNEIMKRDIINYTTVSKEIRVRVPIGIAYDADVNKAKEIINRVSLELDWVMKEPPPKVVVKNFGDSAVNLEARIWISEPRKRMDTISHITDRVKAVFQQEGIEIPFPKRDIYIKTRS
ncbi:mechanosensitive ion channel family protein [Thermodesulfobacteriota bacterium]